MDIDVTKRLRLQKLPAPLSSVPTTPADRGPLVPSAQAPVLPSSPPDEEVHTIRFVAPMPSQQAPEHLPAQTDPVTGWLVVTKGLGRGRFLPLGYGIHPVGRAEDQRISVRFGDKKISRRSHVEIAYDGKGRTFYITPGRGGSTLGHLNGQPVLQPAPLHVGDRILLGDTELAFVPFCGEAFDWQQS